MKTLISWSITIALFGAVAPLALSGPRPSGRKTNEQQRVGTRNPRAALAQDDKCKDKNKPTACGHDGKPCTVRIDKIRARYAKTSHSKEGKKVFGEFLDKIEVTWSHGKGDCACKPGRILAHLYVFNPIARHPKTGKLGLKSDGSGKLDGENQFVAAPEGSCAKNIDKKKFEKEILNGGVGIIQKGMVKVYVSCDKCGAKSAVWGDDPSSKLAGRGFKKLPVGKRKR